MDRLLLFYASHMTNISQCAHCGRGKFTSYKISIMYCTWWCTNCTQRAVQLEAFPGHPSDGHNTLRTEQGNDIRYIWGYNGGGVLSVTPFLSRPGLSNESPGTPPLKIHCNQGIRRAAVASPNISSPLPLSWYHRTPQYGPLWRNRINIPYSPSYPHWHVVPPDWKALLGRETPVLALPPVWTR